jgi:hypothetical protein
MAGAKLLVLEGVGDGEGVVGAVGRAEGGLHLLGLVAYDKDSANGLQGSNCAQNVFGKR